MTLGALEILFILAACAIFLVPLVFYLLTLQKALSRCSAQNRTLSPGLVWLVLIPLFGLGWHFIVVINLANSLHAEFLTRKLAEDERPGLGLGLAMCMLQVAGAAGGATVGIARDPGPFGLLGGLFGLVGFVCWIVYWVSIAGYSAKIAPAYAPAQPQSVPPPPGPAPV